LEEQVAHWKNKYESIAKMYAQLRKEHLDLLGRLKDLQIKANAGQTAIAEKEKMHTLVREKTAQFATALQESTLLKAECERIKQHALEESSQLRRELAESQLRMEQVSSAKGAETQELVARFHASQQESAARLKSVDEELERVRSDLNESRSTVRRLQSDLDAKMEEIIVLQAGMDQSLLALQQVHDKNSSNQAELLGKLDSMSLEHRLQTDKIMGMRRHIVEFLILMNKTSWSSFALDSVLEDCLSKVADGLFDMDNSQTASTHVTPQLMLSLLERATATSEEFSLAFVHHLTDGDPSGSRQADAIRRANNLAYVLATILRNARGLTAHLEDGSDTAEDETKNRIGLFLQSFRGAAQRGQDFFRELQSAQLSKVDLEQRPQKVQSYQKNLQESLRPLVQSVEDMVSSASALDTTDGRDVVDVVEDELVNASKTIQEAAALLASLLAENAPRDPKLTQVDLQVHRSLL
jgi:chromosome segregation ATPase